MKGVVDEQQPPWPPPRGPRSGGETGRRPALAARPANTYAGESSVERRAVQNYRDLVEEIYRARADRDLSLRGLAELAEVAPSRVNALETGSVWPHLRTMSAVAGAVGLQLHVDGDADVSAALHRLLRREHDFLQDLAYMAARRPSTLSELRNTSRSPSMRTVLAVAAVVDHVVELRPVA